MTGEKFHGLEIQEIWQDWMKPKTFVVAPQLNLQQIFLTPMPNLSAPQPEAHKAGLRVIDESAIIVRLKQYGIGTTPWRRIQYAALLPGTNVLPGPMVVKSRVRF